MIVQDLLKDSTFTEKHVLQKLIMHHLRLTKEEIWTYIDTYIDKHTYEKIIAGYNAYVHDKKPLEYIVGYVEFANKKFDVNEHTLIPRPETEYMIQAGDDFLQGQDRSYNLRDIGTGCGVLGISILVHNPEKIRHVWMTDIANETLEVAQRNYHRHASHLPYIPVSRYKSSLLDAAIHHPELVEYPLCIMANLPYIPEQAFEENVSDNVKKREPKVAFVAGEDGLDYYRQLFAQLEEYHTKHIITTDIVMFLEMMTRQGEKLRELYGHRRHIEEVKTFHFNIRIMKVTPSIVK